VSLDRTQIQSMRAARGRIVDGLFLPEDPNRTRLFFSPTARPLERGETYVSNYILFFPFAGIGVTDRFSLAGGTPILPGNMGDLFYLAPTYTVARRPGLDLAVGALAFFVTRELDEGSAGILYGAGTLGDPDRALTAMAGWGFSLGGGDSRIDSNPVPMAGGEVRTGEHTKFLIENWFVIGGGSTEGILVGGIRSFGERPSADLGLGMGLDRHDSFCFLPLVNFVYDTPSDVDGRPVLGQAIDTVAGGRLRFGGPAVCPVRRSLGLGPGLDVGEGRNRDKLARGIADSRVCEHRLGGVSGISDLGTTCPINAPRSTQAMRVRSPRRS